MEDINAIVGTELMKKEIEIKNCFLQKSRFGNERAFSGHIFNQSWYKFIKDML